MLRPRLFNPAILILRLITSAVRKFALRSSVTPVRASAIISTAIPRNAIRSLARTGTAMRPIPSPIHLKGANCSPGVSRFSVVIPVLHLTGAAKGVTASIAGIGSFAKLAFGKPTSGQCISNAGSLTRYHTAFPLNPISSF